MIKIAFSILIFITLCLFEVQIEGQNNDILFSHYSLENGLSQNTIDDIIQDNNGFLWIATWQGLNKYDGYKFINYFENRSAHEGISSNFTRCLEEDSFGNIWIGTDRGLDVFIYKNSCFLHYFKSDTGLSSNEITSLHFDKDSDLLWIGTLNSGLDVFTVTKHGLAHRMYHFDENTDPVHIINNNITNFFKDNKQNMWICTSNGVTRIFSDFSRSENIMHKTYPFIPFTDLTKVNSITYYADSYWFATLTGLIRINFSKKEARLYSHEAIEDYRILHNSVNDLLINSEGQLLVGTLGGLCIINSEGKVANCYSHHITNTRSLSNNFVNCLFEDNDKNIWIGTDKGGINRYNLKQRGFEYYVYDPFKSNSLNAEIINSILDTGDRLYIGTAGGGLNVYDKKTKKFSHYNFDICANKINISRASVSAIYLDNNHDLWVGTWGNGLNKIINKNFANKNILQYTNNNTIGNHLSGRYISSIEPDNLGDIWIGSNEGLDKIEPDGKITNYDFMKVRDIGCLLFDSRDQLWIGCETGLNLIQPTKGKQIGINNFSHLKFLPDSTSENSIGGRFITSLHEDSRGNIWVGTYDKGLSKLVLNKETALPDSFFHFTDEQGLSNMTIYGIEEDNNENLWLSTDNGLSKFLTKEQRFICYYTNDGLLSNQFYWSANYKGLDGKLYFGCVKGLHAFYPDSIEDQPHKPIIQLTDFKIFNKSVYPNSQHSPLTQNINDTRKIVLNYDENTFSFSFVAINFNNTKLFGYNYYLKGVDKGWINAGKVLEASYTKLNPGDYTFSVVAFEKSNPENKSEKEILIIVRPPIYKTIWFRILAILLALILILSIYYSRIRSLQRVNVILETKVKRRTHEIKERNKEIVEQNEIILNKNEEINVQKDLLEKRTSDLEKAYEELSTYKNQLELIVQQRTKELQIAKYRAEESDKLKSSFLDNLSHEIRTPLNAIIGFSNLLFDDGTTEEEKLSFKSLIENSSNTLIDLIYNILEISKLEAGHINIVKKECNLHELLLEISNVYTQELTKYYLNKQETLKFEVKSSSEIEGISILTDPIRVNQILTVLINNAIKFSQEGTIELGCKISNDKFIQFYVSDQGIGIEKEYHDVIFERFRKAEETNGVMYRGAGLGLTIASRLIDLLGGTIWVDSEVGKGTKFYFTIEFIPVKISNNQSTKIIQEVKSRPVPDLSGMKILVAEDDDANMLYIERLLKNTHAIIQRAQNGQEALKAFDNHTTIDIVLMDIKMPIMNGYETFKQLRNKNINVPIIAQTAYGFSDDNKKILEMGFNGYIAKPIEPKLLYDILNKYARK